MAITVPIPDNCPTRLGSPPPPRLAACEMGWSADHHRDASRGPRDHLPLVERPTSRVAGRPAR